MSADKQLEILHDHYKETFQRIREAEQSRDRLFLWIVGLFTLLALEIGYPAEFGKSMQTATVANADLNLSALPLPALLSATWVLTVALTLRYCQTSILIRRQYPYLHALEDVISPHLGGGTIYRREGHVYLDKYPLLLNVAWVVYAVVFPLTAIVGTLSLLYVEQTRLGYPQGASSPRFRPRPVPHSSPLRVPGPSIPCRAMATPYRLGAKAMKRCTRTLQNNR